MDADHGDDTDDAEGQETLILLKFLPIRPDMQAKPAAPKPLAVCAEQLRQTPGPAVLSDNALALSARLTSDRSTLRSCAGIFSQDPGLALKLLRTVNSAMFNPAPEPVIHLGHAAALLGTEALVQLVGSVPRGALSTPANELSVLGLLTAHCSQRLMALLDPHRTEEAYLTGLLRNIGELVFAIEKPVEY
jgi:HD-like signal output (HDOD) protein